MEEIIDIFSHFNRKSIDDRKIDTLIGLSKGILADGKVDQSEAEFLLGWLVQSRQATQNPVILNLLQKVDSMLSDGFLDKNESTELIQILRKISGEPSEVGELAKSGSLPVDDPQPNISYDGRSFLFTGTFAYGTRKECKAVIESFGGTNAKSVTKALNYLVLGTYVTDSWIHETFGRKIEKAVDYRGRGVPIAIVTEDHWVRSAGLI